MMYVSDSEVASPPFEIVKAGPSKKRNKPITDISSDEDTPLRKSTPYISTPNVSSPNVFTPNVSTPNVSTSNASTPNVSTLNVSTLSDTSPMSTACNTPPHTPRVKVYPNGTSGPGPWVVFFRPKCKPLNVLQISKDLARYSSVIDITKVRPNKLRVSVSNWKQANEIVTSERFSIEYHVYIPAHNVEIDGVITEMSLTKDEIMAHGVGRFKDLLLTEVKILDCSQLQRPIDENGTKKYFPSDSFRVTFAGSALPQYVVIDKLKIPVRLYVPRVMNCQNCIQLGHTMSHCCNKARCSTCGESHGENPCKATLPKCLYCGELPHDLSTCEKYKSRREKLKLSLKERSKKTFADILKNASPLTVKPSSNNIFASLPLDEGDIASAEQGSPVASHGNPKKRKTANSAKIPEKTPMVTPTASLNKERSATKIKTQVPPGLRGFTSDKDFPALPGTPKTPNVPSFVPEPAPQAGIFKLSDIVDAILSHLNITDPLRSIIISMLPLLKSFLQPILEKWPLLAVFISLDV